MVGSTRRPEFKFDNFEAAQAANPQRIAPETTHPPAEKIVQITKALEELVRQGRPVYLLHFPRGATPIVEGIHYAWQKLHPHQKFPFETRLIPLSRETHSLQSKTILERYLSRIPDHSIAVYVDEMVTGKNMMYNVEDMLHFFKKRDIRLVAHGLVNQDGSYLEKIAQHKLDQLRKHKSHRFSFFTHHVPLLLPWTDNTPLLGYNWSMDHMFPLEPVLAAMVGPEKAQALIRQKSVSEKPIGRFSAQDRQILQDLFTFAKAFEHEYRTITRSRYVHQKNQPFVQTIRFGTRDFDRFYSIRDKAFYDAIFLAANASGFSAKYPLSRHGRNLVVNHQAIPIPRLKSHLLDTHPVHERERGRFEYKHHLASDGQFLLDFSHSGMTHRFISRFLPFSPSAHLRRALKRQIGLHVHHLRHPSKK